jgi:hypothetical protein
LLVADGSLDEMRASVARLSNGGQRRLLVLTLTARAPM